MKILLTIEGLDEHLAKDIIEKSLEKAEKDKNLDIHWYMEELYEDITIYKKIY